MSFKRLPIERHQWERFCVAHSVLVGQLPSLAIALSTLARFEELLSRGHTESRQDAATLAALSEQECAVLCQFVNAFQRDWETYFVDTLYPAYFRELRRRELARRDQ